MISLGNQQKIFYNDDTDDVVDIIFIDGNTRVHGIPENSQQFVVRSIDVYARHVNTWCHDIFCYRVSEFKHIVDKIFFFLLDHTILMAYIDICL